jgi:hypothetical protein
MRALAIGGLLIGCGPAAGGAADTGGVATTTGATTTSATADETTSLGSTTTGEPSGSSEAAADTSTSTGADVSTTADEPACHEVDCSQQSPCADGEDNDGDGLVDLADPECTGMCHMEEGSFQGWWIENWSCTWDCFFDQYHSAHGDDGCFNLLRCDPENPGEHFGCEYPSANCPDGVEPPSEQCLDFCQPLVPPGCDCFGCCDIQTDDGPVTIFLAGHPDCRLDNLEPCTSCTLRIDECGNACEHDACEICVGESAPPEGCAENTCDNDMPCAVTDDCPCTHVCMLGCCMPIPP